MPQKKTDRLSSLKASDVRPSIPVAKAEKLARTITRLSSHQKAAANLTSSFVMRGKGVIDSVRAIAGVQCGAGESMTVDVQKNGSTVLSAVVTHNSTNALDQFGTLLTTSVVQFVKGDVIDIIRAYTAGGTPAPISRTLVEVDVIYKD